MPDHLDCMLELFEHAEWINQAPMRVSPQGEAQWLPINHGTEAIRESVRRRVPVSVGINYAAYRRDTYLRLPVGWKCAPPDAGPTDVYMWAKFFEDRNLIVASSAATSVIKFPSKQGVRAARGPEQRMAEISVWLARAAKPGLADQLRRDSEVFMRMVTLFSIHRCGACTSANAALAQAGFEPVGAHERPRPAVDGSPMVLPVTAAQRGQVENAWALLRGLDASCEGFELTHLRIDERMRSNPYKWIGALRWLMPITDSSAAMMAAERLMITLSELPAAQILAVDICLHHGDRERATDVLQQLTQRWPASPAIDRLRSALAQEGTKSCLFRPHSS